MAEYGDQPGGGETGTAVAVAGKKDVKGLVQQLLRWSNMQNICPEVDADMISRLGQECVFGYKIDDDSREDWEKKARDWMDMALQRTKPKSFPWPKASNVCWPLLSQAVSEFAESVFPTVMDGSRIVKGKILGSDKGQIDQAKAMAIAAQMQQEALLAQQQQPQAQPQGQTAGPPGAPQLGPGLGAATQPGASGPAGGTPGVPAAPAAPPPPPYLPGKEPGAKRRRADKVSEHMSWQLLTEQDEWQTDSDRLLRALPIIGCAARKSWFDPVWGRNCSMYVSMFDLVVNYNAKSLETAPRLTEVYELYPYEIEEKIRAGDFIEFTPGQAVATEEQSDNNQAVDGDRYAPHLFLEQHCFWDLDGDGLDEPYSVTIHKSSQKVVRIVARFEASGIRLTKDQQRVAKIAPLHFYTLYQFMPNPESAIYGHGFGHTLGPINESINSAINQMFDAGTLQNLQGGFIGTGLSMHGGAVRFKMGEFKPVNSTGGALRDAIYMPDFKGPSVVMFQMFGLLVEAGRQLAGIGNISTGQQSPASTDPAVAMAMIEQGTKVFKGVYKRILRGLNAEFAKLFSLNRRYMPEQGFQWQRADEQFDVTANDYEQCAGVETVGDPSLVTDIQKLARAQVLYPFKDDPRCNGTEIIRRIFEASNVDDIDEVIIANPPPNPFAITELQMKQAELATEFATQQLKRAQSIQAIMQARKFAAEAGATGAVDTLDQQLEREWVEIERNNSRIAALNTVVEAHKAKLAEDKLKLEHHAKERDRAQELTIARETIAQKDRQAAKTKAAA